MLGAIKDFFVKLINSRLLIFVIVILIIFSILVQKLFTLQIINGDEYLTDYAVSIKKTVSINGTRGNIYDRNGKLLAYNELSYTVTIEDIGAFTNEERSEKLNEEIDKLITIIEENGDSIINDSSLDIDESGNVYYTVDGRQLMRFRADIFGYSKIEDLKYNKKYGFNEAEVTAEEMYNYLLDYFAINTEDTVQYDKTQAFKIMLVRYYLSQHMYTKYIAADVAKDVSVKTVAVIKEHAAELPGVDIREDTKRIYNESEYLAHIVGYTGKISESEYDELVKEDDSYKLTDIVGKSGIEQYMELQLQGDKGSKSFYVNNVGKIQKIIDYTEPGAGNDVYLSIDSDLQKVVYKLIEQELAGIICVKLINAKEDSSDELMIPIYDVYNALIGNEILNISQIEASEPGTSQNAIYNAYLNAKPTTLNDVRSALTSTTVIYDELDDNMRAYISYCVSMLQDDGIFDSSKVDSRDDTYKSWKAGKITVRQYLEHAIDMEWIDTSIIETDSKYSDSNEIYDRLVDYTLNLADGKDSFSKLIYKRLIFDDVISPSDLCASLFEQGLLEMDENALNQLRAGNIDTYQFMKEQIKNIRITPAQLALDPCTGSCVIMDPNNGELLACVSYPGYDNNKLANEMDSEYYNSLLTSKSLPLYNNATQQTTAPGSTFKMVTAAAGLTENYIQPDTLIMDEGKFDKLGMNLRCWIYPSNHGEIDVIEAIKVSCNYFFCELGNMISTDSNGEYSESKGLEILQKYADEFGLSEKTGIEISESNPNVADEYPISASIGQSNNSYTTVQLCRYASALATSGQVYDLTLLSKVVDKDGNVVQEYSPQLKNTIEDISPTNWSVIQTGMRQVVEDHKEFDSLQVLLAGKTGTAQENKKRPNHAVFVGYAPYDAPQYSIACRIAYGYASSNTCDLTSRIMKYMFNEDSVENIVTGKAADVGTSSNRTVD